LSTFHFDNFLRVYSAAGETQKALDLLRKYYGGMLKLGSRTIWEQFELSWLKNASPIDRMPKAGRIDVHRECGRGCFQGLRNSLCHGWGASPIAWMMETLAGISPVGDGFCRGVRVAPKLCDLDYVSAICPTPYGDLTVMARRGEKLIIQAPKELKVIRR
ncbi:MAG: alpha-L-rhamnosidase, partial [Lentisphaeria bacterium]|nr:alpha-L-rhamnosidase [Lentisphaeria bacterium]